MTGKGKLPDSAAALRKRAEDSARQDAAQASEDLLPLSPEENRRILNELRVHQIELEMQNEELRHAQSELDASRARYFSLYDLAPVGYCTLSEKGRILEANLTAATLLNVARGTLVGQSITRFIHKEDQDIHYLHGKQLFEVHSAILQGQVQAGIEQTVERQAYELRMVRNDGTSFWAHLAATVAQDEAGSPVCRVVMDDITDRRRMEEALQNAHDTLEHQVEERTAELAAAMQAAEKGRLNAEAALVEIQKLKDQLEAEKAYLIEEIRLENNHENIIGQSDGIKFVISQVEQIAGRETTVLVLGETGTGKELVVRAIHGLSLRKNRVLAKVNCAALHANLIESELFGHEKGAFTGSHTRRLGRFEVARGATLFLDEIGELPMNLQAKLLRVLQDGEFERLGGSSTIKVDVRIIAATNRDLEEEVRKGRFREDLWYRLNVFPITIPPLRDRMEDIPLLVDFYVQKISKRMGKTIEMIPASAMRALQHYHWPGNIRELENVLERAVINSSGTKLRLADELKNPPTGPGIRQKTLEAVERDHIVQTLERTRWKLAGKNSAAEILGIDPGALRARMRELDIRKK